MGGAKKTPLSELMLPLADAAKRGAQIFGRYTAGL